MEIIRYTAEHKKAWNEYVAASKNGFFMFDRAYMDYHADRFQDHSLMFYHDGVLCAVLPANENAGTLYSHQGLTFGGFLMGQSSRAELMLEAFKVMVDYLRDKKFIKIEYKAIPYIYHTYPAQEDLYGLFRYNARISRVDASTAVDMDRPYPFNKGKKASIAKARKNNVGIRKDGDLENYFDILNARLKERYDKASTHNAAEMRLLQNAFPENIKLYSAHKDGQMIGGVLLYISQQVVHTQYIGATAEGLALGANELAIQTIIDDYKGSHQYLDFGISNENRGAYLNFGLVAQKEHFGGRAIVHQFYEINL